VLCPRAHIQAFCDAFAAAFRDNYPTLRDNADYTAIINDKQKHKLEEYLDDARMGGATLIAVNPADDELQDTRKMPMILALDTTDEMMVRREEIFGPILPIIAYDSLEEAIGYVNGRPRPLALYYFDWDKGRAETVLNRTHSGGACINDTMSQAVADDIPFGGVGASGMGHYHGEEGFRTFSKAKGVVRKGRIDPISFIGPPWNNLAFRAVKAVQKLRFRRRRISDPN
jgi:coniferyl-aldehyde dehydrogenase